MTPDAISVGTMISSPYTATLAVSCFDNFDDGRSPVCLSKLYKTTVKKAIASIGKHKALPIDANFDNSIVDESGSKARLLRQSCTSARKLGHD
jgi:hypothetical protein